MEYARNHIKRYWGFAYRRSIGISMLGFALMLAIGTAFTNLVGSSLINGALVEFIFWGVLIAVATLILVASFAGAHMSSVLLMNDKEHATHSKHIGAWLILLVIGAIAFVMPILFFGNPIALIVFMFSFGGMLWVMYFSVFILFRHAYHEIAIAASTLWIAFLISFMGINHVAPGTPIAAYSLFISTVVMIAVAGITGMAMLFNASREFSREFRENAPAKGNARAARRRRRASR